MFRGVTWLEEPQFKDSTGRNDSLISRKSLICRDGVSSMGEVIVENEAKKENIEPEPWFVCVVHGSKEQLAEKIEILLF